MLQSDEIKQILPHRYPFLLVDRIDEMGEDTIVGRKCVSSNEMQFLGHFPQKQVMPGVLIVEALAQTGAVLLLSKAENKGKLAFFAGIEKMRFHRVVVPGDVITLKVHFTKQKLGLYFADVEALVEGKRAARGTILCALEDK